MANGQIGIVARQIQRLFGGGTVSGMDEGELLHRFATRRDPAALEALVTRHGPMVLGVCRRVLGHSHDAEDAFQATFLVLAKRAGAIRDPDRLGPWLHGVAHRVAIRSRANAAKRRSRERPGAEEAAMVASSSEGEFDRAELRAALDEEVRRLPEKFRAPVILCYLDGLTHDEAAVRLRCPVGTIRSRLATGRARLRERLSRRGVAVPSAAFASAFAAETASAAVPSLLLDSTVRAAISFAAGGAGATAAGMVSAGVASLAEGVTTTMMIAKFKVLGGVLLAGALTVGVGGAAARQFGGGAGATQAERTGEDSIDDLLGKMRDRVRASGEDSFDELLGKLRDQVQASEQRSKTLKDENRTLRDEVQTLRKELRTIRAQLATVERAKPDAVRTTETATGAAPAGAPRGAGLPGVPEVIAIAPPGGLLTPEGMAPMAGGPVFRGSAAMAGSAANGMGSMMGAMGGGMGPRRQLSVPTTMQTGTCIVVHKPKSDKVSAYSNETGEWATYEVPKGTEVLPIAGGAVVALYAKGEEIGQITAFDPKTGKWYPLALKPPAKGQAVPMVSQEVVVYTIGHRVYAFSALSQTWDVLELEEGAKPVPQTWINRVTVEHDDHLYIFSMKNGKWTDFDAKAGKVVTREQK